MGVRFSPKGPFINMTNHLEYYELNRIVIDMDRITFVTAALINCGLCGHMISGNGGPGYGSICISCGDALKRGQLVGCVVWENDDGEKSTSQTPQNENEGTRKENPESDLG